MFEGLAQDGARELSQSLSPRRVVSHSLRAEEVGAFTDGSVHVDWPVVVQPTFGTPSMQSFQPGQTVAWHHGTLEPSAESGRKSGSLEDWGVRRQHSLGLSVFEGLGSKPLEAFGESGCRTPSVELQLLPLLQDVLPSDRCNGAGHDALSDEAQWTVNRSIQEPSIHDGNPDERTVAVTQECGSLREKCSIGSNVPDIATESAASLPPRRKTARGCDVRPSPCSKTAYKAKGMKGQYVADLFAGKGGVAKACRQLGYKTKEWEINRGVHFDLTRPSVLRQIRRDIAQGLLLAAMLAPPCSSFSIARDRTAVIRTKQYPWGVPDHLLSSADQVKVRVGNQCFRAAIKIISWLDKYGIPWILENPFTSKCWYLPPLQKLMQSSHVQVVQVDFCYYGTRWRKRTQLLCGNLDAQDVRRLRHLCSGRGLCSFSGKQHFQLTGSNHQGIPWTRVAQPYPAGLCRDLAFTLTCPTHY
eukprot:Skav225702  [mRNA]  locus=scaffold1817:290507:291919:+ [translate_table: standard]